MLVVKLVSFLGVILLSFILYLNRDRINNIQPYGYLGIFLISLISNSTVFFPVPGVVAVFAAGALLNIFLVSLVAGLGGALGEISGYILGSSGRALIGKEDVYEKYEKYIKKYGLISIVFLSAIPNPFFDVAGVAAGALKIPLWKFILAALIGITLKMFLFASLGYASIEYLL